MKHRFAPLLLFLVLAAPLLAGPQAGAIDKRAVVDGLILGRDQSQAVKLLRDRDQRPPAASDQDRLFADFQAELAHVLAWAETSSHKAEPPPSALERLEAAAQLLERRLARIDATLEHDLPSTIRARQDQAHAAQSQLFDLLRQLRAAASQPAKRDQLPQLTARLEALQLVAKREPPILRASLPYERALASAAALPTAPAILPSYQDPAAAPASAVDLTHSDDTPLSPAILAQAQALDYDYVRIFDFVRSQVRTQVYAGSMKGAETTLRTRAGNDVDQACLLAALFRASGLPTRFVQGIVRLSAAEVGAPLGLTDAKTVVDALARAGVPHQAVLRGSQIVELRLFHTWLSAYVPYAQYRGTTVDASGRAWLPLDPSLKSHQLRAATGLPQASAFNGAVFPDDYLAGNLTGTPLEAAHAHFDAYLLSHPELGPYENQLAALSPSEAALALLPASLPYPVDLVQFEGQTLPADQHHRLRIVAVDPNGQVVMDQTLPLNRLLDHRLTLTYEPATVDDHNVIQRFYSRSRVPAYLVRLRPQLNLDGLPAAVGSGDLAMGQDHRLTLTLDGPAGSRSFDQTLVTGGYAAIGLSAQQGEPPLLETRLPDDREQQAARLLHTQVARYLAAWDSAETELANLYDLALVQPRPAMALLFSRFQVQTHAGLPMRLDFRGAALDAPIRAAAPLSRLPRDPDHSEQASSAERTFMRLCGLQGSALESDIFARHWGVTSVSADAGLIQAGRDGIQVLTVTAANLGSALAQLDHPSAVRAELTRLVGLGYEVRIPLRQIDLAAWHGSVWAAFEPTTGASGYFLAGGLAGGETAEPPADWILDELAEILGNPYDGEPNTDPLAAARIRRLPGADGQIGVAGENLEQPLTVLVTDRLGRPVAGAQVLFNITLGGGKLNDAGPAFATQTDHFGIAQVAMTLNQKTGDNPVFAYLHSGDEFYSQLGEAWINASVASFNGSLNLDLPFIVYGKPGEPTTLRRLGEGDFSSTPGTWSGTLKVRVEDSYQNPIANAPVTFSTNGFVDLLSDCPVTNPGPLTFFRGTDCEPPVFPGTPCGSPTLTLNTSIFGTYAYTMNGVTGGIDYLINVDSPGTTGFSLKSRASGACESSGLLELQSMYYINGNGNVRDAARPGSLTARPRRAFLSYGLPVGNGRNYRYFPTTGNLTYEVSGGGTTGLFSLGAGAYEGSLMVGGAPGGYPTVLRATDVFFQYIHDGAIADATGTLVQGVAPVYAVTPEVIQVEPDPIILDLEDRSRVAFSVEYQVAPPDYDAPLLINIYENGQLKWYRFRPQGPNSGSVTFPPGLYLDLHANYTVELVVNPGDDFELKSEPVPINVTQQIFSHVANDIIPDLSSNMPVGGGPVSNNAVGPPLLFYSDYDIPNQILCEVAGMNFGTTQSATVSLVFARLDENGEPDGFSVELLNQEHVGEGDQPVILPLRSRMGEGKWHYTLTGIADKDGHSDAVTGYATISVISRNALPVGHASVKGIDLFDGSFIYSAQDLQIPGKGIALEFSHSYISSARNQPGVMGFGWSHNYLSSVTRTRCGDVVVSGAEGGSMRFVPEGTEFRPLRGYHGTLRQKEDGSFEFFPPGGTKYHFVQRQPSTWWLQSIEDNNGNRTELTYLNTLFAPLLQRVTDATGRTLEFSYEHRTFGWWRGEVLTQVVGPGGLLLNFTYDDRGNLINVTRAGAMSETYTYEPLAPVIGNHLLSEIIDNLSGGIRRYQFHTEDFEYAFADTPFVHTTPIVASLIERDGTSTGFSYQLRANGGFETATISDGRGQSLTYTMNEYGAATAISGPGGAYTISWDMDHVVKSSSTNPNGHTTTYSYDSEANLTDESIDGKSRTYAYYGKDNFANPIKILPSTYTDRAGRRTNFFYDEAGNLTMENKGGFVTSYAYDSSGKRTARIDGSGNLTRYEYDKYGYLVGETDPNGAKHSAKWDVRGRQLSSTDALGQTTHYSYDERDRPIIVRKPGGINLRIEYNDGARTKTEFDANNSATVTTFDPMSRITSVRNPLGETSSITYDGNGNKISETDFGGRTTTYTWDGADHMASRTEPLGRTTLYQYDPLGNLLSETIAGRSTSYTYNALGERTSMRRGPYTTTYSHDGEGNLLSETDPLNRTTTRTFNALNLELTRSGPMGSGKTFTYDPAGRLTAETTFNTTGNQIFRYVVDGMGRRIQTTDPSGAVSSTSYDKNGKVVRQVDGRGKVTRHTYDPAGNLDSTTDPEGHTTTYAYDKNGNRLEERLPNGNVISRTFDRLNREITRRDSLGLLQTTRYDAAGNRVEITDAAGNATLNTYNDLNYLTASTQPEGRKRSFEVNLFGEHTSETDPAGNRIEHTYDELGRLTSSIGPEGYQVSYTYDAADNRLTETNPRGILTTFTYNDLNQIVTQVDPIGTQTFTWDLVGNKLSATDRMGVAETWTYDKMNRQLSYRRAGVMLQSQTWDDAGNRASVTDANGNPTSFEYDGRNLLIRENRPNLAVTRFERDPMGDVVTETQPAGRIIRSSFDKRRRTLSQTNGAGEEKAFAYDPNGNTTEVHKPQGTWTMTYDRANRLTSVTDPLGHLTSYTYDSQDNLLTQTLGGHTTTFEYDAWKRRTAKVYADGIRVSLTFDANGNHVGFLEANGNSATFAYDSLDRLIAESYAGPGGNVIIGYSLDNNGNRLLSHVSDTSGSFTEVRSFDLFNRLTSHTDPNGRTLQYTYDPQGNRLTMRDFDNLMTSYSYDALNRLDTLTVPGMGTWIYSYLPNSLLAQVDHPNGTSSTYTYDLANRVTALANRHDGGVVSSHLYSYDSGGRRTRLEETNGGPTQVTTYSHDAADRLTGITYPSSSVTYTLDAAGNRLTETLDGVTLTYSYNQRHQLTELSGPGESSTYLYDPSGNLLSQVHNGQARTYTYNARNRLVAFSGDGLPTSSYRYDAQGRRFSRNLNGHNLQSTYDGDDLIAEFESATTQVRYHYGASRRLAEKRAEARSFFLQDVLGTPVALTAPDGQILTRYVWNAWGKLIEQTGSSPQPFGFTGYQLDGETGLYYARNRYYDADIGRFLREDPYAGDTKQPVSLHPYLYGSANPTLVVDPSGRNADDGHYYTTYFIAKVVGFNNADAQKLALFSQLPDEVGVYDAINQVPPFLSFFLPWNSSITTAPNSADKRYYAQAFMRISGVQGGLHGLSGKNGPKETRETVKVLKEFLRQGDLEGAGIVTHRLADTFTHRNTEQNGELLDGNLNADLYIFPMGHAEHGTAPDQTSIRPELYRASIFTLAEALSGQPLTKAQVAELEKLALVPKRAYRDSYSSVFSITGVSFHYDMKKASKLSLKYIRDLILAHDKDALLLKPEKTGEGLLYKFHYYDDIEADIKDLLSTAGKKGVDIRLFTGGLTKEEIKSQLDIKAEKVINRFRVSVIKQGHLGQAQANKIESRDHIQTSHHGVLRQEPIWTLDQCLGYNPELD